MSDVTESYLCWNFSVGPDYFFTKNRYSWISHANIAIWKWRTCKISSSTVVDLWLVLHAGDNTDQNGGRYPILGT